MNCLQTSLTLHYLHHDGHSQRVFRYVFFAFLARCTAAFGIFRFVQLVLLRIRHAYLILQRNKMNWLWGELSPDVEEPQQSCIEKRSPRACRERRHGRRALTLSLFPDTKTSTQSTSYEHQQLSKLETAKHLQLTMTLMSFLKPEYLKLCCKLSRWMEQHIYKVKV